MSTKLLVITMITFLIGSSRGDNKEQEKEECAEQLAGLATCLPYVQGQAKAPTPDCCSGLKQVLKTNKKCLCVIIRDRNDPDLGLQVNVSLALSLPSICHAPADVTKCPALLHLDPKSPEAQVFYQLAKGSNSSSPAPAPSDDSAPGPSLGLPPPPADRSSEGSNSGSNRTISMQGKNEGRSSRRRWVGLEIVAHLLTFYSYIISV